MIKLYVNYFLCGTVLPKCVSSSSTDLTGESSDVHPAVRDVPRVPLWYLGIHDGQAAAHAGSHQHADNKATAGRHKPQSTKSGRGSPGFTSTHRLQHRLGGEIQLSHLPTCDRHHYGTATSAQAIQLSACFA